MVNLVARAFAITMGISGMFGSSVLSWAVLISSRSAPTPEIHPKALQFEEIRRRDRWS